MKNKVGKHPPELLTSIGSVLKQKYPPGNYKYIQEEYIKIGEKRVAPDIQVKDSFNNIVCVVEVGYTRPEKFELYRALGIKDIRWFSKNKNEFSFYGDGKKNNYDPLFRMFFVKNDYGLMQCLESECLLNRAPADFCINDEECIKCVREDCEGCHFFQNFMDGDNDDKMNELLDIASDEIYGGTFFFAPGSNKKIILYECDACGTVILKTGDQSMEFIGIYSDLDLEFESYKNNFRGINYTDLDLFLKENANLSLAEVDFNDFEYKR